MLFLTETGRASPVSELSGMTGTASVLRLSLKPTRVVKHVNLYFNQFCRYVCKNINQVTYFVECIKTFRIFQRPTFRAFSVKFSISVSHQGMCSGTVSKNF